MNDRWTYSDLIDLEYCLSLDREFQQSDLHERDRRIYLDIPEDRRDLPRDRLILRWLQARKRQVFGASAPKSPGTVICESYRTLGYLLATLGIVLGFVAALSFLAYSGTTPVNVLNFLFLFIFSQVLIMAVVFPVIGLRMAGLAEFPAPIVSLYALISSRFSGRVARLTAHLPAELRSACISMAGIVKKHGSRYRQAAYWPFFSLSQYVMVSFNLGLLTATLYRLITSDIAFGWQSTIQFSAPFIHKTVRMLALPWSWAFPHRISYPSEAEIEGSRIILKDGIYHLATQDLVSWWPFLVLCIVVYGLLFRSALVAIGRLGQQRSLRKLEFNTPALIQLVMRMRSPLVTSQAQSPAIPRQPVSTSPPADGDGVSPAGSALLLIPAEMSSDAADAIIDRLDRAGFRIAAQRTFMAGYGADQELFAEIAAHSWPEGGGIAAVVEAWMPPINETVELLRNLRAAAGPSLPVWVVLAGQPNGHGVPAPVTGAERSSWRQKIDELADPYLELVDP